MDQFLVTLTADHAIGEDAAQRLRDLGTLGIWEVSAREWRAYFTTEDPRVERDLLAGDPGLRVRWERAGEEDWAARYQASLRPIPVGKRFVILPSPHLESPWPERISLRLVPGMAFGTGEHFTTSSCLRALERLDPLPASALDVGCGTGILSAAAWKLGCRSVVACDTDPEACVVSRESAAENSTPYEVVEGSAKDVSGTFHLVFANILAQTLVAILPDLSARLAPGGFLLGSGILLDLGDGVLEAASSKGLDLMERRTDGEWWTFLWRRT